MYLTINFLITLMVSVQEIIRQRTREISKFESQLQEQSKLISEQEKKVLQQERKFIGETSPVPLTIRRQIFLARQKGVGKGGVLKRAKQIKKEKKALREKAEPQFRKAKEEITKVRKQIIFEKKRVAPLKKELDRLDQFERGRTLVLRGRSPIGLETKLEREGFRFGRSEIRAFKERREFFKKKPKTFKITKRKLEQVK